MLNLRRESQGCIHSFQLSREYIQYGPFTSGMEHNVDFKCKGIRNGHIKICIIWHRVWCYFKCKQYRIQRMHRVNGDWQKGKEESNWKSKKKGDCREQKIATEKRKGMYKIQVTTQSYSTWQLQVMCLLHKAIPHDNYKSRASYIKLFHMTITSHVPLT